MNVDVGVHVNVDVRAHVHMHVYVVWLAVVFRAEPQRLRVACDTMSLRVACDTMSLPRGWRGGNTHDGMATSGHNLYICICICICMATSGHNLPRGGHTHDHDDCRGEGTLMMIAPATHDDCPCPRPITGRAHS